MPSRPKIASALACLFLATAPALAVAQSAFTVDDALELSSIYGWELSPDGSWIVASVGDARGRIGVNSHRTGDPTYVGPASTRLWLIDTATGERDSPAHRPTLAKTVFVWKPTTTRDGSRRAGNRRSHLAAYVRPQFSLEPAKDSLPALSMTVSRLLTQEEWLAATMTPPPERKGGSGT